ncbi:hypothetical protein GCM10009037_30880 [Halarchaeum grantii]|uniref:Uncharacterized protein n=1 Tax=Halarchaeum grantii TaxID=1193105 RepID=A0A830F1A9_9EURY|nr:hypothetical protein GCM10009037_30880 [Halarchaeum grantii]
MVVLVVVTLQPLFQVAVTGPFGDLARWFLSIVLWVLIRFVGALVFVLFAWFAFTGGTRRMPRPLRSGRKPTTDDTNHVTMAGRLPTL